MISLQSPPEVSPIRVALVEDDVNFQNALSESINSVPDMVLLGLADTLKQGLKMLEGAPADVLLVDLGLPDGSGIDVIKVAHKQWPSCNIMVSTTFGDELNVMQSLEAGAAGYLLKDSTPEKMVQEIRSLYDGGSPISPLIARQILMRFRRDDKSMPPAAAASTTGRQAATLSVRELEVLEFITKGFTTDEIADLMAVSFHTVQTYVRRIYAKLEVKSKTEAIYEARKQGLLSK